MITIMMWVQAAVCHVVAVDHGRDAAGELEYGMENRVEQRERKETC